MIKAITFDLDGVYFVNGKSNFVTALRELGVTEEKAIEVFLKSDQMNLEYKCGKMTDQEYWSWAISQWNLNLSVDEIIGLLIKGYETNNKVVQKVKKARGNGYKTLICSNNFPARIQGLQKKFNFLDNFDAAVFSYKVGITKPNEKIFQELITKSRVRPEEIVFADDNEANLEGAKSQGIEAFFFENFDQFMNELQNLGVNLD